jgi:ATP-binding protein involved in chromosome partitioning
MAVARERLLEALRSVEDPELHRDIVALGMVKDLRVDAKGNVHTTINLTTPACPLKQHIREEVEKALLAIEGVHAVDVSLTAEVKAARLNPNDGKTAIPGVKNVLAVGSGKGGVGKSTVSVNLAIALARQGARVGLLDADFYGPNAPILLGLEGERPKGTPDGKIRPLEAYGISVMSVGFLVSEDTPLVWRGPMLHGLMKQFLEDVAWGELDYLVVDLPPGTGDVQLTLAQSSPLMGALIVVTPQKMAIGDAKKAIAMFQKVNVPILGVVENMSGFVCPKCHEISYIFSGGGGQRLAEQFQVPFLGQIPLDQRLGQASDIGRPLVATEPLEEAKGVVTVFNELALRLAGRVSVVNAEGIV